MPTYSEMSQRLSAGLRERGEWAGIPMPLPGLGLVVEDRHPLAKEIAAMQSVVDAHDPPPPRTIACAAEDHGLRIVNHWRGRAPNGLEGVITIVRNDEARGRRMKFNGPGKYDHVATDARKAAKAAGIGLIVIGGEHGDGFSVQMPPELLLVLPELLRTMATDIDRQLRGES